MEAYDEEEQLEQIKQWWKQNWLPLVGGLVVGLGAIGGYQYYGDWQQSQAQAASSQYEMFLSAVESDDVPGALAAGDQLKAEYSASPYAAQAALRLARVYVERDQIAEASAQLDWVNTAASDDLYRHVAQLRKARLLWGQGSVPEALALLDSMTVPETFAPMVDELRGDIHYSAGQWNAARTAYQRAFDSATNSTAASVDTTSLKRKLDNVAGAQS